ncbi:endonuclease 8-like 3 [Xenopus tropicalis]|uniref:Endonuclease 8-like 3 n=1 Tax=Xenopus tropicalis TaxID=8364 RepID=Q28I93_XENTR|nr:endonuclease 8-like 3 [Xenopus tropicalis]CAJ83732.1 novel protein containing Zn-finger in Ran binding protein and others domain and 2 GRF zinc finger domains [Xenopus tropicalis]|eukprot:NP_001017201.1 endonuclease 8-like 3 [Xenopus tropicalis]
MVEGPGCTLNGEKIRARVEKGQSVVELRGSAVSGTPPSSCYNALSSLTGCSYTGVQTLGKELFMYFGLKAIRVHFGMNGSIRLNQAVKKGQENSRPMPVAVLEVQLEKDLICFYESTVDVRNVSECQEKIRFLEELDVCSSKFSFSRAECEIKKQKARMLCDILLDQMILPGVGNIIKNEALFDSGLHPGVQAGLLTDMQVSHLVKMTRDFTLLFYKCRKSGSALYKHYKVYKRPNCGQCDKKITVCRLGENNRMTYFCPKCQNDKPQHVDVSKLPKRNSLIGWVQRIPPHSNEHVATSKEEHWACTVCTLINKPSDQQCDACLTQRPEVSSLAESDKAAELDADLVKYPCNNFAKLLPELKLNRRTAFGNTTLVLTDFGAKEDLSDKNIQQHSLNSSTFDVPLSKHFNGKNSSNKRSNENEHWTNTLNALNGGSGTSNNVFNHPQKKLKTVHQTPNKTNIRSTISSSQSTMARDAATNTGGPNCSTHNVPCALQVVRKEGENKGRSFYTCSLPRERRCQFFEWADLHFPFCNHGKRCIVRTVLKLGPNNGKNFYVCPMGKDKQCNFFEWAKTE